jgi:hypothetical protein
MTRKPDQYEYAPFYELGLTVHDGRISCSVELLLEVLFGFPLRYLFAIGNSLGYLALEESHPPYSAGTIKPAYSQ